MMTASEDCGTETADHRKLALAGSGCFKSTISVLPLTCPDTGHS